MKKKGTVKMAKRTRRNHGGVFKAKVALEAVKGEQTLAERSQPLSSSSQPDLSVEDADFRQGVRGLWEGEEIRGTGRETTPCEDWRTHDGK